MKKLLLFLLLFFVLPVVAFAHSNQPLIIDEMLSEIMAEQAVDSVSAIDCDEVSEHSLEELGEAWMNQMHPSQARHDAMDEMMGGEGSQSLELAHINMGQSYLGCGTGSMMGGYGYYGRPGNGHFYSMMGGSGFGSLGWLLMILFWLFVVGGVLYLMARVVGGGYKRKSAIDVLNDRYAKGEIDNQEYNKIKQEINKN